VKRKSDSSDDQIFDEEEERTEPQQKRLMPSLWVTAKGKAPSVPIKRRKSDEGEYLDSDQQNLTLTFASPG
jgi:hypothetical protein